MGTRASRCRFETAAPMSDGCIRRRFAATQSLLQTSCGQSRTTNECLLPLKPAIRHPTAVPRNLTVTRDQAVDTISPGRSGGSAAAFTDRDRGLPTQSARSIVFKTDVLRSTSLIYGEHFKQAASCPQ